MNNCAASHNGPCATANRSSTYTKIAGITSLVTWRESSPKDSPSIQVLRANYLSTQRAPDPTNSAVLMHLMCQRLLP